LFCGEFLDGSYKRFSGNGAASCGWYGRKVGAPRDASYVYNQIQCAPMLFWLSEALGAPSNALETAFKGVVAVQTLSLIHI